MTINELRIQLDFYPENRIDILENTARKCSNGYLFVDSLDGHCYLFDKNGNEDDVKKLKKIDDSIFYNSNIESIVIPDFVEIIGDDAFENCGSLKSLTFKGKTMKQIKEMKNYPFGIKDESIIRCI